MVDKSGKWIVRGFVLAFSVVFIAILVTLSLAGVLAPSPGSLSAPNRDDEIPVIPGPGYGTLVIYQTSDGSIVAVQGYQMNADSKPGEACLTNTTLEPGRACLDVTNHTDEAQLWADVRNGRFDLWYVDLETTELKRR